MKQKIKNLTNAKILVPAILLVVVSLLIARMYALSVKTWLYSAITILFVFVPFILSFENCLGIFLFLHSFSDIYAQFWLRKALTLFLFVSMIKHAISIIKKEKRFLICSLILSLVLVGYCFIGFNYDNIGKLFDYLLLIWCLYFTIVNFKDINKSKLLWYFIAGIFVSSLIAFVVGSLHFEQTFVTLSGRFQALTKHPNTLQMSCGISLACLLVLYFNKRMNIALFATLAFFLIGIGLLTKSKAFLIILALLVLIFLVVQFFKNKKIFAFSLVIILLMSVIFMDEMIAIINRFTASNHTNILDKVFTGRFSIWQNYFNACTDSFSHIMFGYGCSAYDLKYAAHNMFLELWYRFGLVGIGLFVALIVLYVLHINKSCTGKRKLSCFLPLILFLLLGFEESMLPSLNLLLLLIVVFAKPEEENLEEKEKSGMKEKLKFVKGKDILSFFGLLIVFIPAMIAKIFIRDFWLVCEDKNEARDNGYWLFKYIRENHPKQKVAYAINKKAVDYQKVKDLGKVIQFGSLSHWFWCLVADKNISSQKNGKPNAAVCYFFEVVLKMRKKNRYFLQHGVIISDLEFLHFKNTNMYRFSVSTKPEYDFVCDKFGYPEGHICLTGLCRFDGLNDAKTNQEQILVMPTWRQWISKGVEMKEIEGSDVFTETNYLKAWHSFLNSEEVDKLLKTYNKKIVFYPHRNMQKYIEEFTTNSENIIIANSTDYDVQTLLKQSALLITDYSSVFFDFAYMKKPIIFYQFDEKQFRKHQYSEGYFDYHNNELSDWCGTEQDLVKLMEKNLKNNLEKENPNALDNYFAYRDNKNCERNYLMIKGQKK